MAEINNTLDMVDCTTMQLKVGFGFEAMDMRNDTPAWHLGPESPSTDTAPEKSSTVAIFSRIANHFKKAPSTDKRMRKNAMYHQDVHDEAEEDDEDEVKDNAHSYEQESVRRYSEDLELKQSYLPDEECGSGTKGRQAPAQGSVVKNFETVLHLIIHFAPSPKTCRFALQELKTIMMSLAQMDLDAPRIAQVPLSHLGKLRCIAGVVEYLRLIGFELVEGEVVGLREVPSKHQLNEIGKLIDDLIENDVYYMKELQRKKVNLALYESMLCKIVQHASSDAAMAALLYLEELTQDMCDPCVPKYFKRSVDGPVKDTLLSLQGSVEFLRLLGFKLDDTYTFLVCERPGPRLQEVKPLICRHIDELKIKIQAKLQELKIELGNFELGNFEVGKFEQHVKLEQLLKRAEKERSSESTK